MFATALSAQAVVVDATTDVLDGNVTSIPNLIAGPGADGVISLREAITAANADPGQDTIQFNIPTSDPGYNGIWWTILPNTQLPQITDFAGVVIDGLTQPGASSGSNPPSSATIMIELCGLNCVAAPPLWTMHGLWVLSAFNTIQGLSITQFQEDGIRIEGTQTGTDNNIVYCNFVGTDPMGSFPLGNGQLGNQPPPNITFYAGVDIIVPPHALGINLFARCNQVTGNLISGNFAQGVSITFCPTGRCAFNLVDWNYLGTDVTGTAGMGNWHCGVYIGEGADSNRVADNLIADNGQDGIALTGMHTETFGCILTRWNVIEDNVIGLDVTLSPLGNWNHGISIGEYLNANQPQWRWLGHCPDNRIGPGNIIAENAVHGINVWESTCNQTDRNIITQNSIYRNNPVAVPPVVGLGIDLGNNGVTLNDYGPPDDVDTGPNQELNFPVITHASLNPSSGQTTVGGVIRIDTNPLHATVEVFHADRDPTGYGEGRTYLGSATPDAQGNWSVPVTGLVANDWVTATTIDSSGNTSEFGANIQVSVRYPITVITSPSGLGIDVDGSPYTAPQTFHWTPSSQHSIGTSSPQSPGAGIQYVFTGWSDLGAMTHNVTVYAPMTYTASFKKQFELTTSIDPQGSGFVFTSLTGTWADSGTVVTCTATPAMMHHFDHWSGDLSGSGNPDSVVMDTSRSVTAHFDLNPLPPDTLWTGWHVTGTDDEGDDVAVDSRNNVIVTGESVGQMYTVKYDENGNVLHSAYNSSADRGSSVDVDGSDNIIVTGFKWTGAANYTDYHTVKYDSTLSLIWSRPYTTSYDEYARGVATDGSDNIIVAGTISEATGGNMHVIKYGPNGDTLWERTYDRGSIDWSYDVTCDRNDNVIVTGMSYSGGSSRIFTVKYGPNGDTVWVRDAGLGAGHAVATDTADNVIVTCKRWNGSDYDYYTVKYNASGTALWNRTWNNGSEDYSTGIDTDKQLNIVVTGHASNGTDYDYFTLKYDQNGTVCGNQWYNWARWYDGGHGDMASGVATDSGGCVIVTGRSSNGSNTDMCTIKYMPQVSGPSAASIAYTVADSSSGSRLLPGFELMGTWDTSSIHAYDPGWGGDPPARYPMYDDGTHGDSISGDGTWTLELDLVPDGGAATWQWAYTDTAGLLLDGPWSFTVTDTSAQAQGQVHHEVDRFSLLSPANACTVQVLDPTLDWEDAVYGLPSGGSLTYVLLYGTSPGFHADSTDTATGLTESRYRFGRNARTLVSLPRNRWIHWKVTACDTSGARVDCDSAYSFYHRPAGSDLIASGTLVGTVSLTDGPADRSGIEVSILGTALSDSTDASGTYRITGFVPDTYTVRAAGSNYVPIDTSVSLSAMDTVDFALYRTNPAISGTQWPVYRHNGLHTGATQATVGLARALSQRWTWSAPGGLVFTNPVISNGYVYIAASDSAGASSSGGSLHKIDIGTGSEVTSGGWPFRAGASTHGGYGLMRTTPAVSDSLIYFPGGRDSTFYCIRASDASVVWSEHVGTGMYYAPPLLVGSAVYWGSNDGGKVYARNRFDGTVLWTSPLLGGDVFFSPIYADGKVFVGTGAPSGGTSRLYALDAADGTVDWQSPASYQGFVASPAYANGKVYAASDSLTSMGSPSSPKLFCFDASDGTELWSAETHGVAQTASPAVSGGKVFCGSYRLGYVLAFDATTGDSLWATYVGGGVNSPAATGSGVLFVTAQEDTSGGDLFKALDASDGSILWSDSIDLSLTTPAVLADTVVVADFAQGGGTVYLYASGAARRVSSQSPTVDAGIGRRANLSSGRFAGQVVREHGELLTAFLGLETPGTEPVHGMHSGVQGDGSSQGPLSFELRAPRPNPFLSTVMLSFSVPKRCLAELSVYDVTGRRVATPICDVREPGRYSVEWDALDDAGTPLCQGVYFCRMTAGAFTRAVRMLLLR
jgi:outer membrane protein assembly factor BamB